MTEIIKAQLYYYKCLLFKEKRMKYYMAIAFILLFFLCAILKHFLSIHINISTRSVKYITNLLFVIILLTVLPIFIYNNIINEDKHILYLLAGINVTKYRLFIISKYMILFSMIIYFFNNVIILPIMLTKDKYFLWLLLAEFNFIFIIIYIIESIGYKKYKEKLKHKLIEIIGILEILSFFMMQNINNPSIDLNWIWISITMITLIVIFVVIYKITKSILNTNTQFSILKKDFLMLIRDFDAMKYLIVTLIIFVLTTIVNSKQTTFISVIIIAILFVLILCIQITFENINRDKKYYNIYQLAVISDQTFIKEKTLFSLTLSGGIIVIYSIFLLITQKMSPQYCILYLIIIATYTIICNLISNKWSFMLYTSIPIIGIKNKILYILNKTVRYLIILSLLTVLYIIFTYLIYKYIPV